MLKITLLVVVVIAFINSISFMAAMGLRYYSGVAGLRTVRDVSQDEPVMNYFIAGMLNHPEPAFQFITSYMKGGITYADFRNTGWTAWETAEAIEAHIYRHRYTKVRIFSISVGDHVARYLEQHYYNDDAIHLEIIAIDPCSSPTALKDSVDAAVMLGSPVVKLGCILAGWISVIPMPFLKTPGDNYSLFLLSSQITQIADCSTPGFTDHTIGVVLSEQDEFLDGDALHEYFETCPVITIPECRHGDTIGNAEAYRQAVIGVLQHSKLQTSTLAPPQ